MSGDDASAARTALDRLATLLADLRLVEDAMAHLDTLDTRTSPPPLVTSPDGVLTVLTFRVGRTHPIERPITVYDDSTVEERTTPVLAGLAERAGRWGRAEADHLATAARPVLALLPADTAAVREALLADRQRLLLEVDTDLADLRLRLAPWRGQAKTSYLLDLHGPLVDAHHTHVGALVLAAQAVTAIELAARGARRSLRHTLEAGVELVDTLLRGWQAAQVPPNAEVKRFLTMAAQGADLLARVAMPKPGVGRGARVAADALRRLEEAVPDQPDVGLPVGVTPQEGRLEGARADQTAAGLAAGVADVVAALDAVLGDVGAAARGHEDLLGRVPLAPREPDVPRPGTFDHVGAAR